MVGTLFSLLRASVPSLIKELRSYKPHYVAKKKRERNKSISERDTSVRTIMWT